MNAPILASLPDFPGFFESITFLITGFGLVLLALFILAGMTRLVGVCFTAWKSEPQAEATRIPAKQENGIEIDSQVLAVISAAVYTAFGRQVRLTHVRRSGFDQEWSREGRQGILSSHNVRPVSGSGKPAFNRPGGSPSRRPRS